MNRRGIFNIRPGRIIGAVLQAAKVRGLLSAKALRLLPERWGPRAPSCPGELADFHDGLEECDRLLARHSRRTVRRMLVRLARADRRYIVRVRGCVEVLTSVDPRTMAAAFSPRAQVT